MLVADPAAGQSMTEAARQALRKLDALLADNSEALHSAIANLNTFIGRARPQLRSRRRDPQRASSR